ncbi:MAG: DUF5103 domain-containing protein [Ferruginibacter sp.]
MHFANSKPVFILSGLLLVCMIASSQSVEKVFSKNIRTAQFFKYGYPQGLAVYTLNSGDQLQLGFDDLDGNVKSYYYTYQLCNYNWQPVNINPFDYIKGFTQNRISTYRISSRAYTKYTHYQAILPERNSLPVRSGNYLLKVFLDGDTSKLAFTKRMLVVEQKALITGGVLQPFTPQLFNTHQKIKFSAQVNGVNTFSAAQQIKVVILQNNRWDVAQKDIPPTFVRGNTLEFNSENFAIFPGGKEWRWLDLRSFRLQSDRVARGNYNKNSTELFLKTDIDRNGQRYVYYPDLNGMYVTTTYETINPYWQGDYATVHFSLATPDEKPYPKKNVYVAGNFTGYDLSDSWKMNYNDSTRLYELPAFIKQGYYNYTYITKDIDDPAITTQLEGNYFETENSYTVLIYYKSFTDRSDQLIGVGELNSRNDRPGFSF